MKRVFFMNRPIFAKELLSKQEATVKACNPPLFVNMVREVCGPCFFFST